MLSMLRRRYHLLTGLSLRGFIGGLALGIACLGGSVSCGSATRAGPGPDVSLASSVEAQAQFRILKEQWTSAPPDARIGLERPLTGFIQRFPEDPQGRWARIYLAWIALQRGDLELAERWLGLAAPGPTGAASDLSEVVRASIELARGRAPLAYAKLSALEGRLIDPDDRLLCLDRLVLASLAVKLYPEAVEQILELAALAARQHRERLWRTLEPRLAEVPLPVLESSLPGLSTSNIKSPSVRPAERAAAVDWMRQQILDVLSRSALTHQDVGLAQRLVATSPGDAKEAASDRSELLWLATQGGLTPTLQGRTLGLALELADPNTRRRAMDVAAGISLTLDLAQRASDQSQVSLETRPVEGDAVGDALARLAGDGAALLVAGFDPHSARQAADFAANSGVPVLLLAEPEGAQALPSSAYVIGANDTAAFSVLRGALEGRVDKLLSVGSKQTPCVDAAGDAPAGLLPTEAEGHRPGLLVLGAAECVPLLQTLDGRWSVGLGPQALGSVAPGELRVRELWAVVAGRLARLDTTGDAEASRWFARKGRAPGWYDALGHDVARLAEAVLPVAAAEPVRDPAKVAGVHRQIAARLAQLTTADLWSSDSSKFNADHRLEREFRALRLDAASERREP